MLFRPTVKNIFIAVTVLLCTKVYGQKNRLVTGSFTGMRFELFAGELESQTGCHFYYDSHQTDSIIINYNATAEPLDSVLQHALQNTALHYSIDGNNNVFITKTAPIQTSLPDNFFSKKVLKDSSRLVVNDLDLPAETNKRIRSAEENKLYEIGIKSNGISQGNATIAGYVRDARTGEAVVGANIYTDDKKIGTTSDQFGYYSLTLSKGRHTLVITSIGMSDTRRQVMLYSDGKLSIDLSEFVTSLKRVVVTTDKTVNVKTVAMGAQKMTIRNIKQVPTAFGEADVLRAVLTLPGVTSAGESSTGLNVRGGAVDQNLILFSDATVYNPSHLFGFFSAFNPDVIKDVELYKSSIPEKYGGRLASVLDVTAKEGSNKKFGGSGGIGPLTAKLELEGPIDSGRTSFMIAGRTSYSDWLLKQIPNQEYKNSTADFYDGNLNISHEFNEKNNLYITGYASRDKFRLNNDTLYQYSNKNANIKWKHIFNNKLYSIFTGGIDSYQFEIGSTANPVDAYNFSFNIMQGNFRADFSYTPNPKHTLDFGLTSILYKLHPGTYAPDGKSSLVTSDAIQAEQALESAIYIGDRYEVNSKLSLNGGLRYSVYNYLGPQQVYDYAAGLPREAVNITDTISYGKGKIIKTYQKPEVRFSARYVLSDNSSVKLSYNTLSQFIQMLSNTTAISPTDIWKLSDQNIKPQTGEQLSVGFYRNFKHNTIETSVELYYKRMKDVLDYKGNAQLILNHHIETDVLNAKGKAYGAEFFIKKTEGKLNGWLSYTYSRTFLKTDDPLAEQPVNNGSYYPSDYDKPNVVNFIGNYRASHRFSVSLNVIYSTGRPITLPIAQFYTNNSFRVYYSDRNQYRIPDYFRTDFSMNIEGGHKIKKLAHSSWTLGIYNITARKNPYSVYFISENGMVTGYKLSIFGTAIPFVVYNFKF